MITRLKPPNGRDEAPVLGGVAFSRLLAILADRGQAVGVPPAVEARGEVVPLVVIDRADVFAVGAALRPQFARAAPALRTRSVTFSVAADAAVSIDLGDGGGPREVQPQDQLEATFASGERALITVQRDGRTARCAIEFDDAPAPMPVETWELPGGIASLLPAPGHGALRCPLVVVEGFPGGHGFVYSHDVLAQHGLLASLQGLGHDLVAVGLDDGLRSLEENAEVVRAALAQVKARTDLPITLAGWSMGGLLARIAVAAAERAGETHRVETLLTWDTPHRGTMTQLGVQWFVQSFAARHPALGLQQRLLGSPANREMDMLVVDGAADAREDPARAALVADLAWPERPRRILLASGRGDGQSSLEAGELLMRWHRENHGEIALCAVGGDDPVASGEIDEQRPSPLVVTGQPSWDGAPGGREPYVEQVASLLVDLEGGRVHPAHRPLTCTIPTISALDLDSALDAPVPATSGLITCQTDQLHVQIDAAAAARVLEELGAPFDPDRFNAHDPGFLADPFPTYARFRQFAPLHAVPAYESLWCFRAAECRAILEDTETWLKHPPGDAPPPPPGPTAVVAVLPPGLFNSDPPAHPALREAVETPLRAALGSVPDMARAHAQERLQALGATERIELVQDYALPVPAHVLLDLLGIALEPVQRATLIGWQQAIALAHDATQSPAVRLQGATCLMALRGFFGAMVASHRRAPVPGLVGMVCDTFAAANLGDAELIGTLCDLLVAGYLSTTFIIATGTWRVLSDGIDPAPLRSDADGASALLEELLRLDGPVQVIDRVASRPTTLAGRDLGPGTRVTAVVGSADRDADVFAAPDEARLGRPGPHMAFGAGVHLCVGAPLARLVAPVALHELFAFAPQIELDGEAQWQTDPYLRAVVSLPLALGRAGG